MKHKYYSGLNDVYSITSAAAVFLHPAFLLAQIPGGTNCLV